ncbi:transposable element Tcb2 transposase [Trichonephila clavipes]|nr:transposable element Tcb2 transposase [Trichonephila clavipes]
MMEADWSARRIALQLGCSDCVISRREDCRIVRNARIQPTASSATLQAHATPLLGAPVTSHTIRSYLDEGHLRSFGVLPRTRKLDCS